LNAYVEDSSISNGTDIKEKIFDFEDFSISGPSHIPDIDYFSFLGASISNHTVFNHDIGINSSMLNFNIVTVPDIEAQHLSFDHIKDS
jgi:hypothetical protein